MDTDALLLFGNNPELFDLYNTLLEILRKNLPDFNLKIHKTQVTLLTKYGFAYLWPSSTTFKNSPVFIMFSFGLNRQIESPRIRNSGNTSKNRWIHHMRIYDPSEFDEELLSWVKEAYEFSTRK